ncbi:MULTISPECIES: hypothetical protein [unclassified Streptomyces]|uniref:hypothetical protein n=1 Tax=unclassified Streptomyces TaxID=2593676 RepID=UPI003816988C
MSARGSAALRVLVTAAVAVAVLALPVLSGAEPVRAADGPAVTVAAAPVRPGGEVTVTGSGWRPRTLLMLLVCGQATPAAGLTGGTNGCANADGRAVTTGADGRFRRALPVTAPPVPCPCVVHVTAATGATARAAAVLRIAGHPDAPLPVPRGGRLSVLTATAFEGSDSLLTWFGAPPARTLVLTVGNPGTAPVTDPVFSVGTAHGVFAPQWDERPWRGTLAPGGKARVALPVELAAGAHGDHTVSVRYGGKVLAERSWDVGRPWGVTLFWVLLCLVVPSALFRIGLAVVDRVAGPAAPAARPSAPDGDATAPHDDDRPPSPADPTRRTAPGSDFGKGTM